MAYGEDSEKIRDRAWEQYIEPQLRSGKETFQVAIKPLMKQMEAEGFPPNHPRQFCKALQKRSFLREKGLIVERLEGPPSGTSTTVVLHYRVVGSPGHTAPSMHHSSYESPKDRAFRLTEKLRGLMKEEIAAHGGAEGYLRWVRSADEPEDERAA